MPVVTATALHGTQHAPPGNGENGTHHRAIMRRALPHTHWTALTEMPEMNIEVQRASCWERSMTSIGPYESNWMLWARQFENLTDLVSTSGLGVSGLGILDDEQRVLEALERKAGYATVLVTREMPGTWMPRIDPSQVLYYYVDTNRYGWLATAIKNWMQSTALRNRLAMAGIRVQDVDNVEKAHVVFGQKQLDKKLLVYTRSYDGFSVQEPELWNSSQVIGIMSRGTWKNFLTGCMNHGHRAYGIAVMLWGLKHQREDQCLVLAGKPLTMDTLLQLEEDGAKQLNKCTCDVKESQVCAENAHKVVPIPIEPLIFDQVKMCQDDFKKNWVPVAEKAIDVVMFWTDLLDREKKSVYWIERGWQRTLCMDELLRVQKKHPEWRITVERRFLDGKAFTDTLRDATILISPFGMGEWSVKDVQAVIHGTLFVKPLASFFNMSFSVMDQAFDVLPDCSNLEDVLKEATSMSHDSLEQRRTQAYDAVKQKLCSPNEDENDVPLQTVEGLEKILKKAWNQLNLR